MPGLSIARLGRTEMKNPSVALQGAHSRQKFQASTNELTEQSRKPDRCEIRDPQSKINRRGIVVHRKTIHTRGQVAGEFFQALLRQRSVSNRSTRNCRVAHHGLRTRDVSRFDLRSSSSSAGDTGWTSRTTCKVPARSARERAGFRI